MKIHDIIYQKLMDFTPNLKKQNMVYVINPT
jgi:hypothetical protein